MPAPKPLKAPFPYFGGKSRVAARVWAAIGNPENVIEPFFGSGAFLLTRPAPVAGVETVNDKDHFIANFWRAIQSDPEAVARWADGPVIEADLHSRHKWLVLSDDAAAWRQRMRDDPHHFCPKVAGWWCWGLCCWIGSGWCASADHPPMNGPLGGSGERSVKLSKRNSIHAAGKLQLGGDNPKSAGPALPGVHRTTTERLPDLAGDSGAAGRGIHSSQAATRHKRPRAARNEGDPSGPGVHAGAGLSEQVPRVNGGRNGSLGVPCTPREGRPQLADAYDVGRGVNSEGAIGTCEARRAWLIDWFGRLADRLRLVRVCCGDWSRVCSSPSTTTRLGVTGVFLDPPYPVRQSGRAKKSRDGGLYATDGDGGTETLRDEVLAWCVEHGQDRRMRIVVAGYEGDGYEALVKDYGWREEAWKAQGGYGNRTEEGRANAARERLWFSPGCLSEATLFDQLEDAA